MKDIMNRWGGLIVILVAIAFTFTPVVSRSIQGHPTIPVADSYHSLRMAYEVHNNWMLPTDFQQDREYNFNLYHYFLAGILYLTSSDSTLILSSLFLSLLSAAFLYLSMKNMGLTDYLINLAMIVYLMSPIYIYTASTLTPYTLSIFLITLSLFLYSEKPSYWSLLPASLVAVINPLALVGMFTGLLIYAYHSQEGYREIFVLTAATTVVTTLAAYFLSYVPMIRFTRISLNSYLTDFGAATGYPFFTILLTAVALFLFWEQSTKIKLINLLFVFFLIISMTSSEIRIVYNIVLSVYAALALRFFINRKWALPNLRDITLLILFSSLLFSGAAYANRLVDTEPTQSTIQVLESIAYEDRAGKVLSRPENGFIIEYFTGKEAYLDRLSYFYPRYEEKLDAYNTILGSSNPTSTKEILDRENIEYIYIDPEMRAEIQRNRDLLLVVGVSENFIKLAGFQDKEAWLYIRI